MAARTGGRRRATDPSGGHADYGRTASEYQPAATVIDCPSTTLGWLGGVRGQRVCALGTDRFGQSGDLPDLYREYRLDADAIMEAVAEVVVPTR